ncbi:MAG: TRAP transporter small permease [Paracoccus sp. (in: a-proteobacteria)]|nr:TRAP transporter small permease [Paracoccus sp. (in: a-proteobacteria)]
MKRIAEGLDWLVRSIGALGVAVLSTLVIWVVFSRYVLGATPRWAEELPRLILVWVTFLGVISGFVRGSHFEAGIRDLVIPPGRLRRIVGWLATAASAAFLVVLIITGWKITTMTWSHSTTALSMPVGLFYLCLPVCAALSLVGLFVGRSGK